MKPTMQNMLTEKELQEGLLGYNFFPRVAKYQDEFPPCFVSTCLCEDDFKAYKALVNAGDRLNHERQKAGLALFMLTQLDLTIARDSQRFRTLLHTATSARS